MPQMSFDSSGGYEGGMAQAEDGNILDENQRNPDLKG